MARTQILDKDLLELGFQRTEAEDIVFEKQNGFPYYYFDLELSKNYEIQDDALVLRKLVIEKSAGQNYARLYKTDPEGSTISSIDINDLDLLKRLIKFHTNQRTTNV